MDRRVAFPVYPDARREYEFRWASELVRALDQLNVILRNPGEGRFTTATFTNLPTSDYGLENGALFLQGNQLFVALSNRPMPPGFSATARLGQVTVTTL